MTDDAFDGRGRQFASPSRSTSPTGRAMPVIGSTAPDAIGLGRYRDWYTGAIGPRLRFGGDTGIMLLGMNGSGKDARIAIPALFQTRNVSFFAVDVKGEMSAVTLPWRRHLAKLEGGRVVVINPYGLLVDIPGYEDLRSDGFNPLLPLDPADPSFSTSCSYIADAIIEADKSGNGNAKHFIDSAKAMLHACIMWEVICATREGRAPTMASVRALICTATGYDSRRQVVTGWPDLARDMIAHGNPQLGNLATQFLNWNNEKEGIASDAKRQTMTFDDNQIAEDLIKGTFDFREMKERPVTVMLILPPLDANRQAAYLRMVVDAALRAVMRPRKDAGHKVVFLLNEFRVLGKLQVFSDIWGAVRGYGIQLIPFLQSYSQLITLYGEQDAKTFVEQAGVLASFGANHMDTAEFLSRRCGTTTKIVASYNKNNSLNGAGLQSGSGLTYSQAEVPIVRPEDAFDLRDGQMIQFAAGMSRFISAYAPPYWMIDQCQARAIRPNPYYQAKR